MLISVGSVVAVGGRLFHSICDYRKHEMIFQSFGNISFDILLAPHQPKLSDVPEYVTYDSEQRILVQRLALTKFKPWSSLQYGLEQ